MTARREWMSLVGLSISTALLGAQIANAYHNHQRAWLADQVHSDNEHVAGCALAGLINDTGKSEFQQCIKDGKITGEVINKTDVEDIDSPDQPVTANLT